MTPAAPDRRATIWSGDPFCHWLERQRDRDDPIGDLARDAYDDPRWPVGASRRRQLCHLRVNHACAEAILAYREARVEFRAFTRRSR